MPKNNRRLRNIIRAGGGGKFRGVQVVRWAKPSYLLVYFDSARTGSTMTMRSKGLTAAKVRAHLIESNKRFGVENPERLHG